MVSEGPWGELVLLLVVGRAFRVLVWVVGGVEVAQVIVVYN